MEQITLDEMKAVKLMNRTDTKFVTNSSLLAELLRLVDKDYFIQAIDGKETAQYHTVYFDSADHRMYTTHHNGHLSRQKLRIRSYVDSGLRFLEVKTKNNRGRTAKERVTFETGSPLQAYAEFLEPRLWLDFRELSPKIENRFTRITLVNRQKTERLTIDTALQFKNLETGTELSLGDIAIIELKRDSLQPSPILPHLNRLRIFSMGFSKYCMGIALTDPGLKQNRLKERLRRIERIIHKSNYTKAN